MNTFEIEYRDYDFSTGDDLGTGWARVEADSLPDAMGALLEQADFEHDCGLSPLVRRVLVSASKVQA